MLKVLLTGCMGLLIFISSLSGCYRLPYNNFKPRPAWVSLFKDTRRSLVKDLYKYNIELVQYGDQITLIVPTDQYFVFNSAKLEELEYKGLEAMLNFMRLYHHCTIAVASFSDNVDDSRRNWRLTNARAHAIVTFLWANGFSSKQLIPQRFGEAFPVGDNHFVRGRAYNRRIEIQWPLRTCSEYHQVDREALTK